MTDTMKKLAVLLIGTLFVLCVAVVLAVSLPVSTAFAAEGEPEATVHDHADGTWTELTATGGTLQSGNYYLTSDVTLTTDITIADNATVTLCLNGYKLTGTGTNAVITFNEGVDFTLEDCSADASAPAGTGVITGGIGGTLSGDPKQSGGCVHISGNSTFTMNGGTISGNTANGAGGGVSMWGEGAFTMNGGTISGNSATAVGGVFMYSGTFTMTGGTISGNTAINGDGGGVFVYGTFIMNGGTISGNEATKYGGGVYVSDGTFTMTNGTISDNKAGSLGGGVYGTHGTFNMSDGTISGNTATNGGGVYFDANNTFEISGGTISGNTANNNGGGVYFEGDTFEMSGSTISGNTATNGGGVYAQGIGMGSKFTISGGTLTDNYATEYGGGVYCSIGMLSTLTLEGCTVSGNTAKYGGGVRVGGDGTLTLEDGMVSGNTATSNGGGVYIDGSKFIMNGGTLSGNTATNGGGGVYMIGNSSSFTMNGGTISGNMAWNGGGVYMYGYNNFTMNGGTISGDRTFIGSGLHVNDSNGTFTMNGGYLGEDIENNGTVSISGGYFAEEFDTAYLAENCDLHDIFALGGAAFDSDYKDGFPYAVYANGTEITSNVNDNIIYDGSPVAAGTDFTVTGADGVEFTYVYKTAGDEFILGLPTNAGEYTVSACALNGEKQFFSAQFNITVAKATYDMSGITFADDSIPYNGEEQSLAILGDLPDGVTVTYDGNGKVNAGKYTVTASFTGDYDNYNVIADKSATLTITKATYDMSGITFADDSVPYNGEEQSLAISGDLPAGVTVTYDGNGNTNVGEYTVTAKFAVSDANYNEIDDMTAKLTITKADYDMSGITFADDSVPYNGEEQSLAISGDLPAGVTVTYDGNGKVNAGEYTVTASFAGDYANYNAIPDMTATLTIEKGVPSYTAPTELTVSVGQNVADITLPDGWAWKDGDVQFGTAGEHKAIAVYTAADTANYAPVEVELTVTVSESEPTEPDQPTDPDQPKDPEQPTDPEQPGGEITSEEPEGLSGGAIAGIVIGCILGVLLIEYGVFALLYKKKLISGAFFGKIYPFIKD